jgi:phosphoribosyl-dephospho-CoA transferase
MNALDTAVLQVIKLHDTFMQLVRTEIILALNMCLFDSQYAALCARRQDIMLFMVTELRKLIEAHI